MYVAKGTLFVYLEATHFSTLQSLCNETTVHTSLVYHMLFQDILYMKYCLQSLSIKINEI